jgi:ferredoxin-NADP reductase
VTAAVLLAYVSAALALQAFVAVAVVFWRRRRVERYGPAIPKPDASPRGAWSGWREFRVARRDYEDRARSLCSFQLVPVDEVPLPPFVPGQYLTLSVPAGSDGTLTRCYSLSDAPSASSYRISVKRALPPVGRPELPQGVCSSFLHDKLQVGDRIRSKAPAGRFVLDRVKTDPVVLIAGGIGITPLLSMLRSELASEKSRNFRLYYGVRNGAEHGFRHELESMITAHTNFSMTVAYETPDSTDVAGRDYQHSGYIGIDLLRSTLPAGRHGFYVCGPPAMMASLIPALVTWGVSPGDIHQEAFGPASTSLPTSGRTSNESARFDVVFRKSARTLVWDGLDANLLDFAERFEVPVESGCRTGSCGTCEVRLVSGTVRYAETPDHDVNPGCCLLCVGSPVSALELDA